MDERFFLASLALFTAARLLPAMPQEDVGDPPLGVTGVIRFHRNVPSRFVARRNIEVWLPSQYDADSSRRYPVLYIHDGQNIFAPATAFVGVDWGVDETMTRLVAEGTVRPAIVVAVWNSSSRNKEYLPQPAVKNDSTSPVPAALHLDESALSDAYLSFLVNELKPFIDSTYRTLRGPTDTFVMGSSMGGLISIYAMTRFPDVFGGAAGVSTHWPAGGEAMIDYLRRSLPPPGSHRFYFDHGTATLDTLYAPYQKQVDEVMRAAGYSPGKNWITRTFPGADHSERAWRLRVEEPLAFLLGR